MKDQRVPILVYHHVYPQDAPELTSATFETGAGIVGENEFRRQMRCIADEGWSVVSTTEIIDWLESGNALPPKAAAIHFDNGWLDTVTVTLPILQEFEMAATCFPITDGVEAASQGKTSKVRTLTEGVIEKPFVTWDQLQQLRDAGWELGAHTASHCKVADKHAEEGDEAVIQEAEISNDLFQSRLGFTPDHFAYPSGSRNDATDKLLASYYRSLRLWHFEWPIHWSFTHGRTSPLAIDCQNIDLRVEFDDFQRIFTEAAGVPD